MRVFLTEELVGVSCIKDNNCLQDKLIVVLFITAIKKEFRLLTTFMSRIDDKKNFN